MVQIVQIWYSLGQLKPAPIATPARTSRVATPKPSGSVPPTSDGKGQVVHVMSASAKSTPIKSPQTKKTKLAPGVVEDSVVRRLSGPLDAAADTASNSMDATAQVPCLILIFDDVWN